MEATRGAGCRRRRRSTRRRRRSPTCTSPFTPAALADGSHTITVRGTDAAGNSGTGATTFTIDTRPPGIVFDDAPPELWPVNYFDMKFHATEPSTLTCSLNGAAFAACTSPRTITTVYNTTSTFAVRATDAAGNVSNASRSWTSGDGLVLHYPWEQGQTRNTSLLAQRAAYSPNGSATLTAVGGWAGTAASSPAAHTYANTIRPLSSSANGGYTMSVWARPSSNGSGTIASTITSASTNGFALSIAGTTVTLQVKDNGTTLTMNATLPLNQWVQLGMQATTGNGMEVLLMVNGRLVRTEVAQTTNGFGPGQAANLTVGPITGVDLDDLRFYNRALSSDELCTVLVRGQLGDGCSPPLRPGFELDFEHGSIIDTGTWLLPLTAPTGNQFSFASTGLGMGVQLTGASLSYSGFTSRAANFDGHSFSAWFTGRDTHDGTDILFENIDFCSESGALCGMEVDISSTELDVFVGDGTTDLPGISIQITPGRHSLLITEQKVPDSSDTQSLSIYVDGVLTVMTLSGGNVFGGGSDSLRLGSATGMVVDELEFWPRDLSEDPEMLCENGLDGEWDPVDESCSLVN